MTQLNSLEAINKWFYFSHNYPSNFIEQVWGEIIPYSLSSHLHEKFLKIQRRAGASAIMNEFYAELDNANRIKLLTWVLENYNDEIKLHI